MSNVIGQVRYSDPRAAQVRDDDGNPYNAIHATIAIKSGTKTDTDYIMGNWHRVMAAVSDRIDQLRNEFNGQEAD